MTFIFQLMPSSVDEWLGFFDVSEGESIGALTEGVLA